MKVVVLDIETTGFDHEHDCILELGIVELDLSNGEVETLFNSTFKEKHLSAKHHSAWIFKNEFMNQSDVRDALDIEHYRTEIQDILDKYSGKITAWNRSFDVGFLSSRGFKFGESVEDPMAASTSYFKIPQKTKWATINFGVNKYPSAQEAWDILFPGNPKIEEHRGLSDAIMEAGIIYALHSKGVYKI